MSSWRNRKSRPLMGAGSLDRSVLARTTSVTSLAAALLGFWPWPSGTCLPAGHSPAVAIAAARDIVPATIPVSAARHPLNCSLRLIVVIFDFLLGQASKAEWLAEGRFVVAVAPRLHKNQSLPLASNKPTTPTSNP